MNLDRCFLTLSLGGSVLLAIYIWRQWRQVYLALWRMSKRIRRAVSGSSEIERICGLENVSESRMTSLFWKALSDSKELSATFRKLQKPDVDVNDVTSEVVATKVRHGGERVKGNVRMCISNIKNVSVFIQEAERRKDTRFKSGEEKHEKLLESLWNLLRPGIEREKGRFTSEWGTIGFQGTDPATDFRGGGILSLQQLVFFAETRNESARRMLREPMSESARYPWACCGIQLTDSILGLLRARLLDAQLYGRDLDACLGVLNEAYADLFEFFHSRWVAAKPTNVLDYPGVFKKAFADAKLGLLETGEIPRPD